MASLGHRLLKVEELAHGWVAVDVVAAAKAYQLETQCLYQQLEISQSNVAKVPVLKS